MIQALTNNIADAIAVYGTTALVFLQCVLLGMGVFFGAYGLLLLQQAYRSFLKMRQTKKESVMDVKAREILEQLGFTLEPEYARQNIRVFQDGKPLDMPVRPDLIVSKGGKSYVVNLKGSEQDQLSYPETRRALLEYYVTYRPNGILLMDMENRRIHDIRFDLFASDF